MKRSGAASERKPGDAVVSAANVSVTALGYRLDAVGLFHVPCGARDGVGRWPVSPLLR